VEAWTGAGGTYTGSGVFDKFVVKGLAIKEGYDEKHG
jgi:hypothetical protein